MEIQFTWKTKLFRIKYEIIQNENIVGTLKGSGWKRKLPGELKGRKILFVTKGFFKVKNLIKSAEDDSLIGEISFNTWKSKAVITVQDKVYYFQFDNFFHTKWNISNENGSLIKYNSRFRKGEIISYTADEVLILTGLYIRDFFRQRASAAAAAS